MAKKLIVATLLVLLVAAAVWLYLPTYRAQHLLSQVATIQVGKTTFADAQKVAREMGAETRGTCNNVECNWYRTIDNGILPAFWIGSGSSLATGIRVQNGVVTELGTAYQIGSGITTVAYADVEERSHWSGGPAPNPVSVQTQWSPKTAHYSALVLMVPAAPPETRKKYYSFNMSCMWKYGGCSDAKDLLPTVEWRD